MEIEKHKINYRRAGVGDIEILVEYRVRFLNEFFNHPEDEEAETIRKELEEYFSKLIPSEDFIALLAEYNGEVIGVGGMAVWQILPTYGFKSGRAGCILNMYTIPEARGKGVCTRLLDELIKEAKSLGIRYLHLRASDDGINIYRKTGFVEPECVEMELKLESDYT